MQEVYDVQLLENDWFGRIIKWVKLILWEDYMCSQR